METKKDYSIAEHKEPIGNAKLDYLAREVIHLRKFIEDHVTTFLSDETKSVISSLIATKEKIYSVGAEKWDAERRKRQEYADTCASIAVSIRAIGIQEGHLIAFKWLAEGSAQLAMEQIEAMQGLPVVDEPGVDYEL